MDWKLEVVVLPVADVDRAKDFYLDQVGFDLQVDYSAGEDFRVVHLIPRGFGRGRGAYAQRGLSRQRERTAPGGQRH